MDRVIVTGSEITLRQIVNVARQGANVTLSRGVNSGYMIVQYTAAALVSKNKVLAHPASVDSIPSSANQEDHVSMGTIAARKAREILENARRVLAIELMCACQAIDLRGQDLPVGGGGHPRLRYVLQRQSDLRRGRDRQKGRGKHHPQRGQAGARRNGGNGQRDHRHHAQRLKGFRGGQVRSSLFLQKYFFSLV